MAPISLTTGCQCGRPGANTWNFDLPISRRGLFLQDSFFENAHSQFNNTVRKILQQWGATDVLSDVKANDKLSLGSNMSRYRQLRGHSLREEDQAVTVASDSSSHKIVMDVGDFKCEEVKVRVERERELVVEGRKEAKEGDFAVSSHSFRRRFILPHNTNMASITSVMSSDGVLTISAPMMVTGCLEIPVQLEGQQQSGASKSSGSTTQAAAKSESCCATSDKLETQNTVVDEHKEHRIPIKIDSTLTDSHKQSQAQVNSSRTEYMAQSNQHLEEKTKTGNERYHSQHVAATSDASVKPKVTEQAAGSIPIKRSSFLPITRRGLFFDDSFFEDMRNNYHSAVTDVLNSWGQRGLVSATTGTSVFDTLNRYRQLRSRNLDVESQAITITADHNSQKIAIDVHEFANEEVKVRVVGEKELVVEGRKEAREGEFSVSSHSFRRRFILPDNTNMAAITSVMSSDGVLTITAPYEVPQLKSESVTIPVHVEKSLTSSSKDTSVESEKKKVQQVSEQKAMKNIVEEAGYTVKKVEDSASDQNSKTSTITAQSQSGSTLADTGISGGTAATESCEVTNMSSSNKVVQDATTTTPRYTCLPVITRGLFFNDSFFKDAWRDFQEAVNDVVSRSSNFCSTADDLSFYRSLRAHDMRDETQAVKSSEDETNYKIVIDVQDFTTGGKINVKAVSDKELVVEGQVEQQEGGARFKKQFHRRFVLPTNIHLESVNSVMSSDGVLTITAPKKAPTISIKEVTSPVNTIPGVMQSQQLVRKAVTEEQMKAPTGATISAEDRATAVKHISEAINKEVAKSSQTTSLSTSHSVQTDRTREYIVPMQVEGQVSTSEEEKSYRHSVNSQSSQQEQKVSQVTDQSYRDGMKVNEDDACSVCSHATVQSDVSRTAEAEVRGEAKTTGSDTTVARDRSQTRMLPISRKGQFFSDSFFADTRQQFTQAVRSVLDKSGASAALTIDMASYRSLLKKYPDLQNQALHVEEDERSLKIVLDVHEFVEGDLKVEVVGEKELVVEGEASREEGISSSTLIFRRRFSLPAHAQVAAISCALSSDGVLTVTAPKLQQEAQATRQQEVFSESQSRMESQGPGMQGWREEAVRQAATQGDGISVRSYSSSVASQQQYSSTNTF